MKKNKYLGKYDEANNPFYNISKTLRETTIIPIVSKAVSERALFEIIQVWAKAI